MYKSLRSMLLMLACTVCGSVLAQDNLKAMQQKFVNEKFGMFNPFQHALIRGRRLARPRHAGRNLLPEETGL